MTIPTIGLMLCVVAPEHSVDWVERGIHLVELACTIALVIAAFKTLRFLRVQTAATTAAANAANSSAIAAKASADAYISAERAWVVAELIPTAAKYGNEWHRFTAGMPVQMSREELLKGKHLVHELKLTNMGRTPAHIFSFYCGQAILEKGERYLEGKRAESGESVIPFDHVLPAGKSVIVDDYSLDVYYYIKDYEAEIDKLEKTAVFHGYVTYQHVFSEGETEDAPFLYSYTPLNPGLAKAISARMRATRNQKLEDFTSG
jgi:hypothetical protein